MNNQFLLKKTHPSDQSQGGEFLSEPVQTLERGLKPFFFFFFRVQKIPARSSLCFTAASASCLHCGWGQGQGQEVPATTKDCSCAIPGLIQNKTRWKFWKNICSHQASSPRLPDPRALGNSVEKQGNISIGRCRIFWQRLLLFAVYTESFSFVHTNSSAQGLSGRVKKSCFSHMHFSPRDINVKDTFTDFENAHSDFNRLMALFEGGKNRIVTYFSAKEHPEHLPARELPQGLT